MNVKKLLKLFNAWFFDLERFSQVMLVRVGEVVGGVYMCWCLGF